MTTPLKALIQERLRAKIVRRRTDDDPSSLLVDASGLSLEDQLSGILESTNSGMINNNTNSNSTVVNTGNGNANGMDRTGIDGQINGNGNGNAKSLNNSSKNNSKSKSKSALYLDTEAIRSSHSAIHATITPNESAAAMLHLMDMTSGSPLHHREFCPSQDLQHHLHQYQQLQQQPQRERQQHQPMDLEQYDEHCKYAAATTMEWNAAHSFYRFGNHLPFGLTREEEEQMAAMARLLAASHDHSQEQMQDRQAENPQFMAKESALSRLVGYEELLRGKHFEEDSYRRYAATIAALPGAPSSCASSPGPCHEQPNSYEQFSRTSSPPSRHLVHRSLSYDSATPTPPMTIGGNSIHHNNSTSAAAVTPVGGLYGLDPDRREFFPASLDLEMIEGSSSSASRTQSRSMSVTSCSSISPNTRLAAKAFVEKRQRRCPNVTPRTMATRRWLQAMDDMDQSNAAPTLNDTDERDPPELATSNAPRKRAKVSLGVAAAATAIVALASPVMPTCSSSSSV